MADKQEQKITLILAELYDRVATINGIAHKLSGDGQEAMVNAIVFLSSDTIERIDQMGR